MELTSGSRIGPYEISAKIGSGPDGLLVHSPLSAYGPGLDLHPDGARFAVTPLEPSTAESRRDGQLVMFMNFFDELRRQSPIR